MSGGAGHGRASPSHRHPRAPNLLERRRVNQSATPESSWKNHGSESGQLGKQPEVLQLMRIGDGSLVVRLVNVNYAHDELG